MRRAATRVPLLLVGAIRTRGLGERHIRGHYHAGDGHETDSDIGQFLEYEVADLTLDEMATRSVLRLAIGGDKLRDTSNLAKEGDDVAFRGSCCRPGPMQPRNRP